MKRLSLLLLLAGLVVACGPSGDDDDDDSAPFTLTDGTYVASNAAVPQNECQLNVTPGDVNGSTVAITATDSVVTIDFGSGPLTMTRTGNAFTLTQNDTIDLNGNGIDCVLDSADVLDANATADDTFSLTETLSLSENSGAECANTGLTFPCSSVISVDFNLQ